MKPTFSPKRNMRADDDLVKPSNPWMLPKSCPNGSIPIRRAQGSGHFRGNRLASYWHNDAGYPVQQILDEPAKNYEGSFHYVDRPTVGGIATISVWNPKVEHKNEQSSSQISVSSRLTHLAAGWMVSPDLYGNAKTRFFIRWSLNGTQSLCYNLKCPGFVQTNHRTTLDSSLEPVSTYGGQQYAVDVQLSRDTATQNWWVHLQGAEMGYWPKELVPDLGTPNGAQMVTFGGEVYNSNPGGQHTSTQMGSGHFSNEGFKKSGFFKEVWTVDMNSSFVQEQQAINEMDGGRTADKPDCYDVGELKRGSVWQTYFFYGGPGRSAKCT